MHYLQHFCFGTEQVYYVARTLAERNEPTMLLHGHVFARLKMCVAVRSSVPACFVLPCLDIVEEGSGRRRARGDGDHREPHPLQLFQAQPFRPHSAPHASRREGAYV